MSATLHVRDLTVSRGPLLVLDGVSLTVSPRQRVGVVAPNGVGKSTLLKAIAGLVPADRGTIETLPPQAAIGYLAQEPERDPTETVRDSVARRTGVAAASAALDAATAALAAGATGADDEYSHALDRWLALGGADLDARIGEVWDGLGLGAGLLDRPTAVLSGGEAARAGLAALQLSRFDVYVLDEPTNDLDLDGLERLERFVTGTGTAVVLVSHDRTFLERTVTDVLEIDEFTHRGSLYGGGWRAYLDERETARRHAWEAYERYDTARSTLASRAQREREWATQGLGRAKRSPRDNDKNVKAFAVDQTEQLAGRAARTERAMERLEVVDKPREAWQLRLEVPMRERGGDVVARLHGAEVDRGGFRLGPVDIEIGAGERIAIVGRNGSGKSTLIGAIVGRTPLTAGSRWVGPGVVFGEMEQARHQLGGDRDDDPAPPDGARPGSSLVDTFMAETGLTVPDARTLLAKFGLVADHVTRAAASLSPGERTRAVLALLMANGATCLVLDEPTNHLDLPAIEQLESALDSFAGTVLLVTHDRSVLDAVRRTRTITVQDGRIVGDEPA